MYSPMTELTENTFPILKTERLTLRQLQTSDDEEIYALRSDEDVNQYLGRTPSLSVDDARKFIQAIIESHSSYWAITLTGLNTLIGTICLYNLSDDHQQGEIGYELLPTYQQKGIMREALSAVIDFAFKHLRVNLLEACTHANNKASIKLLEKLNFVRHHADEENMIVFILHT
ncbi:GNAT family N-acetyltransferase [Mucilaginibacter sp. CSA2-8R]|uniref:GNAT family N-acetyltransferase n=1 Tax=Mucilaginibacter sp. CSA2-8R TaxID=3141542 RepID=UPI00315D7D80